MKGILRGRASCIALAAATLTMGALAPTADAAQVRGGAAVVGTFSYAPAVPANTTECRATVVDIELTSVSVLTIPGLYAGPLSFEGTGVSHPVFCEKAISGAMAAELDVFGENAAGDVITCSSVAGSGGFVRAFTVVGMDMWFACELNGVPSPTVGFHMGFTWTPTAFEGDGDITEATLAGGFFAGY